MSNERRQMERRHALDKAAATSETVEVSTPWAKFKGKGPIILPWMLVTVMGFGLYHLVNFNISQWGTPFDLRAKISAHNTETNLAIATLTDSIRGQTWVMANCLSVRSIRSKSCDEVNLEMPDSLRGKR